MAVVRTGPHRPHPQGRNAEKDSEAVAGIGADRVQTPIREVALARTSFLERVEFMAIIGAGVKGGDTYAGAVSALP